MLVRLTQGKKIIWVEVDPRSCLCPAFGIYGDLEFSPQGVLYIISQYKEVLEVLYNRQYSLCMRLYVCVFNGRGEAFRQRRDQNKAHVTHVIFVSEGGATSHHFNRHCFFWQPLLFVCVFCYVFWLCSNIEKRL